VDGLRQKALLLVTAVGVLAATMPGVAGAAAKKDSSKDANSNGGTVTVGPGTAKGKGVDDGGEKFKFSAKSTKGADATNNFPAKGKFYFKQSNGVFYQGKVQCLEVDSAGTANFVGPMTKSNTFPPGSYGEFSVSDSGQPKGQGDTFSSGNSPNATPCVAPFPGDFTLTSGNIVVHATTP
jgi:hypothetical protein